MKTTKPLSAALQAKNKAYADWQTNLSSVSKKHKFKHLQSKVQKELREIKMNDGRRRLSRWNAKQTCMLHKVSL